MWEKSYVYLGGRLLATTDLYGTKYHHPDRLGTRLVTDGANGTVTTEQVNLPYGTALTTESSGATSNRRFTSYDRSATTGMDYAVNRFYNSAQGRFNQVDPIGMGATSLSDPQSLNLYSYCGNDPVNRLDPDGLFWGKLFGWVGKAFKFLFKVSAIALFVVAIVLLPTMIAAGGFWLSSGAWFGWGSWAGLVGAAGVAGLAGWHNGKLGEIAGAFLTTLGKSRNFRTPPISSGAGGISRFLQSKEELQKKAQEEALKRTGRAISRRIARKVFRIADIIWDLMYPEPVGGDLTIQDIVNYPDRILWKIPGKEVKTPGEVEASLGQIPDGWKVEAMRHSQSNPGGGWILREYNSAGNLTGRMIQWHPGGGHHGPHPYWKVSTGRGTIRIGPQF